RRPVRTRGPARLRDVPAGTGHRGNRRRRDRPRRRQDRHRALSHQAPTGCFVPETQGTSWITPSNRRMLGAMNAATLPPNPPTRQTSDQPLPATPHTTGPEEMLEALPSSEQDLTADEATTRIAA